MVERPSAKVVAVLTFLIWACIIVLGRLIAYDHVWGSWSPAGEAVTNVTSFLEWLEGTGVGLRHSRLALLFPLLESAHAPRPGAGPRHDRRHRSPAAGRGVERAAVLEDGIGHPEMDMGGLSSDRGDRRAEMFNVTNAVVYAGNTAFRVKVALLLLAGLNTLVFELTAGRTVPALGPVVSAFDREDGRHRVAGALDCDHLRGPRHRFHGHARRPTGARGNAFRRRVRTAWEVVYALILTN